MPNILNKRVLVPAGIFLLALVIALLLVLNPPEAKKRPRKVAAPVVDVISINRGDYPVIVEAMGEVVPYREVQLTAQVGGEIVQTAEEFAPGGLVVADELLLQIDPKDYELELDKQQALFHKAEGTYEIELGQQKNARQDLAMLNQGRSNRTKDTYLVLRGPQLKQAEAELRRAKSDLEKAQLNLKRTQVKAPFNALIVQRQVSLGAKVTPQQTLATLVATDEYWVKLSIPIDKLPWIKTGESGSRAIINMSNARGQRSGQVSRVVGRLEANSRLAPLIVSVKDPLLLQPEADQTQAPLLLGDYVAVTLSGEVLGKVFRLPHHTIHSGDVIWVLRDEKMVFVPISVLHKDQEYLYFNAELTPDERIIVSNIATPVDGMRVQLRGESSKPQRQKPSKSEQKNSPTPGRKIPPQRAE